MNSSAVAFSDGTVVFKDAEGPDIGSFVGESQAGNSGLTINLISPTKDALGGPLTGISGAKAGLFKLDENGNLPMVDAGNFDSVAKSFGTAAVTAGGQPVSVFVPAPLNEDGSPAFGAYIAGWLFYDDAA